MAALIPDPAVAYLMDSIDLVLVGAEGVTQNGGIINQVPLFILKQKVGTYQIAILAQQANKPFHVIAESYKFVQLFPLAQSDLPTCFSLDWKDTHQEDEVIQVLFRAQ